MSKKLGLFIIGSFFSIQVFAFEGFQFQHKDWYLVCDNTGTCRAAGYSKEAEYDNPVAVLFERKAGPATKVSAKVFYGSESTNFGDADSPNYPRREGDWDIYHLFVNGRDHDVVKTHLNQEQVNAILSVVTSSATIKFAKGNKEWQLSDSGASAIFRKMDEFQGRLKTPNAIVVKGKKDESTVYPEKAAPVVYNKAFQNKGVFLEQHSSLFKALFPLITNDVEARKECSLFDSDDFVESATIEKFSLDDTHSIITIDCWAGGYNITQAFWVINNFKPYEPQFIRTGGYYRNGEISLYVKGRGIGDCGSLDSWVYNGYIFVHTRAADTGLCRAISGGGIDPMPTLVSDVKLVN